MAYSDDSVRHNLGLHRGNRPDGTDWHTEYKTWSVQIWYALVGAGGGTVRSKSYSAKDCLSECVKLDDANGKFWYEGLLESDADRKKACLYRALERNAFDYPDAGAAIKDLDSGDAWAMVAVHAKQLGGSIDSILQRKRLPNESIDR